MKQILWVIGIVVLLIGMGCVGKSKSEPQGPAACFDRRWSQPVVPVRIFLDYSSAHERRCEFEDSVFITTIRSHDALYIYPSSQAANDSIWDRRATKQVLLWPLRVVEGGFERDLNSSLEAFYEGEVRVGGTDREPKTAAKYLVTIEDKAMSPSRMFAVEGLWGYNEYVIVRVR